MHLPSMRLVQGWAWLVLFAGSMGLLSLCSAQSTPQSPVKVHGGATTFFTHDRKGWVPLPGHKDTFCTTLSAFDLNQVHVSGFYGMSPVFRNKDAQNGRLDVHSLEWRIEFLGHEPDDAQFKVRPEGIALQASRLDCTDQRTGTPSLRISPIGAATFYRKDLLPSQIYPGNKRFRSTCSGEDADVCERVAQIKVFPNGDQRDRKPTPLTLNCPDGACTVYVGQIKSVSLAPTVRIISPPRDGAPTAR